MEDKLVTLASYTSPIEANIIKTKLEAYEIPAFIFDENIVGMNQFYSNAVGGVKVKIPASMIDEVVRLLNENKDIKTETEEALDHCPECGSSKTEYEKMAWPLTMILSVLLFFPIPFIKRKWKCLQCGYKWRSRKITHREESS